MTEGDQESLWGRTTDDQKVTTYQSIVTMYKSFMPHERHNGKPIWDRKC